jgi:crotonobetainyl-CoA:carnitine CoA-transferase CaiB-like acyl-CoA transferase
MDRVMEIGGYAAGFAGRLFVQAGYEVVRVESGESSPAWVGSNALDLYLHAGKRRVGTCDRRLISELAGRADIVIAEAPTADGIDALGFDDWAAPVKAAITPFGRTGPKRNWQAASNVLLAMGGYSNLMGDPDRAPLTLAGHYAEFQSGGLAYTAANACRLAGRSNSIDIGVLEVVMSLSQYTTVLWHCAGEIRSRHGNDYWSIVPSNLFRCADGWVYVNIVPWFWDPFPVFLDRPELLVDERFETNDLRMINRDALHEIIAEVLAPMTVEELTARADECRIPCGVVATLDDVLDDAHLASRGIWQVVKDPSGAAVRSPRPAWHIHGDAEPALALATVETVDG